jgi:hypothetical protein
MDKIMISIYQQDIELYQHKIETLKVKMNNKDLDESYHGINIDICQKDIDYYLAKIRIIENKINI